MWVPKSWSFIKLHEVGNFPTWIIFSLKVSFNGIGFLRGRDWPCDLVPRFLGLNIGNFWDWLWTVPDCVEVWF